MLCHQFRLRERLDATSFLSFNIRYRPNCGKHIEKFALECFYYILGSLDFLIPGMVAALAVV